MRWVKLLLLNVAVFGVLLVLGLAIIEVYLRASIPASTGESIFESTMDTRRYKVMKPNARMSAWGSELRTNELGFRDDDFVVPPKRPGSLRVVVLGDSFTVSAGVDYPKIYTSLLQKALSDDMNVEVVNLAVGGYNIIQYELVMDEVAMKLKPDLIIVAVFPFNDLSSDTYRANHEDALGLSKPSSAAEWYERLYVYRAFLGRAVNRLRRMVTTVAPVERTKGSQREQESSGDAKQNLDALRRIMGNASAAGIPAVIAMLPNTDTFEAQGRDFAPFIELCAEQRWECINLLEPFLASKVNPASLRLNVLDSHPNERYNSIVAGHLADSLRPFMASLGAKPRP